MLLVSGCELNPKLRDTLLLPQWKASMTTTTIGDTQINYRFLGMELYWRDNYQCPSEDEYKQMTIRKTGGLFNLAVRLMQLFSEDDKTDYVKLTSLLGKDTTIN